MEDAKTAFRLTYSTMFDPPPALDARFEAALVQARTALGREHAMWIAGRDVTSGDWFEVRSPIDRDWLIGRFTRGSAEHARAAVAAASAAQPAWAALPYMQRGELLMKAATLIEERVFEIAAALALEVGKNRMESLGEVQETADLMRWYVEQMQENDGFDRPLPNDPLKGYVSRNRTVLKPYGVWVVIAPFNFPLALAGGPLGAALVAGNTAVFKVASSTSLAGRLLMNVFRDAGLPDGAVNFVTGAGDAIGNALVAHPDVAGITFTGSYPVGMRIVRAFAARRWPHPCIAEMGGKNAAIVSRHADLERAATGIVRSAFGLQGQKCSACSRVFVERAVAAEVCERLSALTSPISIGDPTEKRNWMGPVIDGAAVARYQRAVDALERDGSILTGGRVLRDGALARGYFVAATVATAPRDHPLWKEEQFLPLVLVDTVDSVDEALALANKSEYGLTGGFYGAADEIDRFLSRVEAGVVYVNRPQGATTGAWPGYQPFGGWKASGTTGKAIGSYYYLPQYLREQSQTIVE